MELLTYEELLWDTRNFFTTYHENKNLVLCLSRDEAISAEKDKDFSFHINTFFPRRRLRNGDVRVLYEGVLTACVISSSASADFEFHVNDNWWVQKTLLGVDWTIPFDEMDTDTSTTQMIMGKSFIT